MWLVLSLTIQLCSLICAVITKQYIVSLLGLGVAILVYMSRTAGNGKHGNRAKDIAFLLLMYVPIGGVVGVLLNLSKLLLSGFIYWYFAKCPICDKRLPLFADRDHCPTCESKLIH